MSRRLLESIKGLTMASFKNLTNENKNPSGESNYLSTVISKRKLVFIAKQFRNGRPYRCIYIQGVS